MCSCYFAGVCPTWQCGKKKRGVEGGEDEAKRMEEEQK
jgi:hypothetical protein